MGVCLSHPKIQPFVEEQAPSYDEVVTNTDEVDKFISDSMRDGSYLAGHRSAQANVISLTFHAGLVCDVYVTVLPGHRHYRIMGPRHIRDRFDLTLHRTGRCIPWCDGVYFAFPPLASVSAQSILDDDMSFPEFNFLRYGGFFHVGDQVETAEIPIVYRVTPLCFERAEWPAIPVQSVSPPSITHHQVSRSGHPYPSFGRTVLVPLTPQSGFLLSQDDNPCGAFFFIGEHIRPTCFRLEAPILLVIRINKRIHDRIHAPHHVRRTVLFLHSVVDPTLATKDISVTMRIGDSAADEVLWPAKNLDRGFPVWQSGREVAFDAFSDMLHISLFSAGNHIGSEVVAVGSVSDTKAQIVPVALISGGTAQVVLQRMPLTEEMTGPKRVYFVRHAQSIWNTKKWCDMISDKDHPLTSEGRDQAEKLAARITAVADGGVGASIPEIERGILDAGIVMCSPLTRALQTALIAMSPVLARNPHMIVSPNAREKRNFGGRDSSGKQCGHGIMQRVRSGLENLYQYDPWKVAELMRVHMCTLEVDNPWWFDSTESRASVKERIKEMMYQIRYLPLRTVIVVGHSHYFREVMRGFLSDGFKERSPALAKQLDAKIISNCGVMCTNLVGMEIDEVELCFGGKMV